MRSPSYQSLQEEHDENGFQGISYATFIHPNPLIYKYYWWVFHQGSPCEGSEFLSKQYRLPTKKAFELRDQLHKAGQSYFLYNERLPRLDPDNSPIDPNSEKWKGVEFARPFSDDQGEELELKPPRL